LTAQRPSVVGAIERAIQDWPECSAIETDGGRISYREFGEHVRDFGSRLESLTAPGEFVGIAAKRTAASIVAMVGALWAGRPFVFIDPRDSEFSNNSKVSLLGINVVAFGSASQRIPELAGVPEQWRDAAAGRRSRERAEFALGQPVPVQLLPPGWRGTGEPSTDGGSILRIDEKETIDVVPPGEVEEHGGDHVHATDGDTGQVRAFQIDPGSGALTHVLVREGHAWGRRDVAIPFDTVVGLDDGIRLSITREQVRDLPQSG